MRLTFVDMVTSAAVGRGWAVTFSSSVSGVNVEYKVSEAPRREASRREKKRQKRAYFAPLLPTLWARKNQFHNNSTTVKL